MSNSRIVPCRYCGQESEDDSGVCSYCYEKYEEGGRHARRVREVQDSDIRE